MKEKIISWDGEMHRKLYLGREVKEVYEEEDGKDDWAIWRDGRKGKILLALGTAYRKEHVMSQEMTSESEESAAE